MATIRTLQGERNAEATIYVGNIDLKVTADLIWELFSQCGIVANVHLPKEKISGEHQGYGFVEFKSEEDADYSIKIMHMVKLYGKPIKVNKASSDKKTQEVGANLFIGNLDSEVDEKTLYDTFSAFGLILSTRISRDPDTTSSKGFGFVSFDNFESSDAALNAMNGQFFHNKVIQVMYAFKKDSKGERHGSDAERYIAANRPTQAKTAFQQYQPYTTQIQPSISTTTKSTLDQQTLHMPTELIPNMQISSMPQQFAMPAMIPPNIGTSPPMNLPPIPNNGFPLPPLPAQSNAGLPPLPPQINANLPPLPPQNQPLPNIPAPNFEQQQ